MAITGKPILSSIFKTEGRPLRPYFDVKCITRYSDLKEQAILRRQANAARHRGSTSARKSHNDEPTPLLEAIATYHAKEPKPPQWQSSYLDDATCCSKATRSVVLDLEEYHYIYSVKIANPSKDTLQDAADGSQEFGIVSFSLMFRDEVQASGPMYSNPVRLIDGHSTLNEGVTQADMTTASCPSNPRCTGRFCECARLFRLPQSEPQRHTPCKYVKLVLQGHFAEDMDQFHSAIGLHYFQLMGLPIHKTRGFGFVCTVFSPAVIVPGKNREEGEVECIVLQTAELKVDTCESFRAAQEEYNQSNSDGSAIDVTEFRPHSDGQVNVTVTQDMDHASLLKMTTMQWCECSNHYLMEAPNATDVSKFIYLVPPSTIYYDNCQEYNPAVAIADRCHLHVRYCTSTYWVRHAIHCSVNTATHLPLHPLSCC